MDPQATFEAIRYGAGELDRLKKQLQAQLRAYTDGGEWEAVEDTMEEILSGYQLIGSYARALRTWEARGGFEPFDGCFEAARMIVRSL